MTATAALEVEPTGRSSDLGTESLHRPWTLQDLGIRVIHAATGNLLRELALDPTKRDDGTGPDRPE